MPTAEFMARLRAMDLTADIVDLLQDEEFSLSAMRTFIQEQRLLGSFRIVASYSYVEHRAIIVRHRFLLLKLQHEDNREVWLRLERRPVSRVAVWRGFGKAIAAMSCFPTLVNQTYGA
jgi:hypothetical protein